MIKYLIILWFSLLGADRIDFLSNRGSFVLTPFLILSPLIIFLFFIFNSVKNKPLRIPKRAMTYFIIVNVFLGITLVSLLFSDGDGIKRVALLIYQVYFSTLIALIIYIQDKRISVNIFLYGSYLGVLLSFNMDILQLLNWLNFIINDNVLSIINIQSPTLATYAPRLAGVSVDMNRGGILLCFYLFFIITLSTHTIIKKLTVSMAIIMIFLTISRSAIVALIIMLALMLVKNKGIPRVRKILPYLTVFLLLLALIYHLFGEEVNLAIVINSRLAFDESGLSHISLINYAFELWKTNLKGAILGVGFGNSWLYLGHFFGDNIYGNFHSLFLTVLVENGLIGFLVFMIMFFYPLSRKNYFFPFMVSILFFNLFYQLILEPVFWFSMAMSWFNFLPPNISNKKKLELLTTMQPQQM